MTTKETSHYRCSKCKLAYWGATLENLTCPPAIQFTQKAIDPSVKELCTLTTTEKLYLENLSGVDVNIYLVNGIKLHGKIIDHDDKTILLHTSVNNNLIYKSAIATIKVENERD